MVLELVQHFIPWAIAAVMLFFIWLIVQNKNRLYKIRHSGRVSEIIDRRRNIVMFIIIDVVLFIILLFYVFA